MNEFLDTFDVPRELKERGTPWPLGPGDVL
jgi:hypothetical protein